MPYIKEGVYPINEYQIRSENPNTSFPSPLTDEHALTFGYLPVQASPPVYDPLTQVATETAPLLVGGVWTQTWSIGPIPPPTVPEAVTMRQARLALLSAGVLTLANDAIAGMTGVEGEAARIEWEYAHEVRRDAPLVSGMAVALGLTGEQLDDLFTAAATL